MNRPNEPLSQLERDLASRLARLGGPREPAPAIDAAILAAARQAVGDSASATLPPTHTRHPSETSTDDKVVPLRRRMPMQSLPVGLGLAATAVLAMGIGWRLYGDGSGFGDIAQAPMPEAAPEAADAAAGAADEQLMQAVILEPEMVRTPPPPPPPLEAPAELRRNRAVLEPAPARELMPAAQISETDDSFMMDEAVATDVGASSAPPPASPAPVTAAPLPAATAKTAAEAFPAEPASQATAARTSDASEDKSLDTISITGSRARREAASGAAGVSAAPAAMSTRSDQSEKPQLSGATDAKAFYDQPPASADSPEVRQAWLQRIRGLITQGEMDAARESLREFLRRYPGAELPEDLRKLAATLPPTKP